MNWPPCCIRPEEKNLYKNIQKLHGHPLLAYPIHLAVKSKKINKVILSTDNTNYASIGKKYGAAVPFIRPSNISNDTSTTEETLKYSLLKAEEYYDEHYDICVFLTATDVFRKLEDLEKCIIFSDSSFDSYI